jgi:magnesium transporter
MAMFIPLIAAMGGNVGVQSSAIVVQGLASKALNLDSTSKKIFKEFSVGIINASIFSSLILAYNLIFSTNFSLTITVSIALFTVIVFASVFGTFIPMFLQKIKIDPAMATGPFISTTNDIVGLFVYLGVGRLLYGVFS